MGDIVGGSWRVLARLVFFIAFWVAPCASWPIAWAGPSITPGAARFELDTSGSRTLVNVKCDANVPGCTDELVHALSDGITHQVEQSLDAIASGREIAIDADKPGSPLYDSGVFVQEPICNLADPSRSGSCGSSVCQLAQGKRCIVCGRVNCNFRPRYFGGAVPKPPTCEKERAWKRGAFVREVELSRERVLQEIHKQLFLELSPRCDQGLKDPAFGSMSAAIDKAGDEWIRSNQGDPITCDLLSGTAPAPTPSAGALFANDRRIPRVAGCYLNAALTSQIFAFAHAAACEVFARAEINWERRTSELMDAAVVNAIDDASLACKSLSNPKNPAPFNSCANREYSGQIESRMRAAYALMEDPQAAEEWLQRERQKERERLKQPQSFGKGFPLLGLDSSPVIQCADGAPDCSHCQDLLYCGTGTVGMNPELRALLAAADNLETFRDNLAKLAPLYSNAPYFDPFLNGKDAGPQSPDRDLASQPSPRPCPSPSPVQAGSPSPSPSPSPSSGPQVNEVVFP